MPTGGGGTRPADAGQATCSSSGGHPPAPAVSATDTNHPDTGLVDTDRGSGSSSGQPRRPRCPVPPPPRHRPQVRLRQDSGGPAAAVAAPRQDRRMSDLLVCAGQVARSTQPGENGCPDAWTPDAAWRTPGARMPRHCGHPRPPQGMGTPRQQPRWTAGSRTVHHLAAMSDRNGTPMCGSGQHARLTARSVVWGGRKASVVLERQRRLGRVHR
jgi:hypothetical protein